MTNDCIWGTFQPFPKTNTIPSFFGVQHCHVYPQIQKKTIVGKNMGVGQNIHYSIIIISNGMNIHKSQLKIWGSLGARVLTNSHMTNHCIWGYPIFRQPLNGWIFFIPAHPFRWECRYGNPKNGHAMGISPKIPLGGFKYGLCSTFLNQIWGDKPQ